MYLLTDFFVFRIFLKQKQTTKRGEKRKIKPSYNIFSKNLWLFDKLFVTLERIWYKPSPDMLEIERSVMLIL